MKRFLSLLFILTLSINLFSCNINKKTTTLLSSPSNVNSEIDMADYYLFACDLCSFMKEQFDILVENYPERYSVLKDKLNEYVPEMAIIEDKNDGEELYIKGNYALIYGEELVDLVKEKQLETFIEEDYNHLIDKGIIKVDE